MRSFKTLLLTLAAALVLTGLAASPAQSAELSGRNWVATPNGVVGVQQMVTVRAPRQAGQVATITFQNPVAGTNAGQAVVNNQGFAYLPWTPDLPGAWTVSASVGSVNIDAASFVVGTMPTRTILLTPGEVRENRTTTIIATVEALGGVITPSGTIAVRDQSNTVVATGTLAPTGTVGLAQADIAWTPARSAVALTATYTPATTAFGSSTSPTQSPVVGGPQAVSLRMPPVAYVGVEEEISAVIQPNFRSPLGGSVAFSLNIDGFVFYPMGGSKPIGNGVGSTRWVPTQPGAQTVGVQYASADFAINGSDTQAINVQPAPTPDAITVTPTGAPAWPQGNVGSLTQGNFVELTPTSQSGNPVTLATDGPCAAQAGIITMLGPGQCSITATSLGNGGSLSSAQQQYTVNIQAPARR